MTISEIQFLTPEQEINDEQSVIDRYRNHVMPFWRQKIAQGVFAGESAVEIRYAFALHPRPLGSIVISSGRVESLIKYKELVYNLYHSGYSVFIHDHRGQGLSGRMTDDPQQGFVDSFDDYVADMKLFYDTVVAPKSEQKPKLLCHSMGSAIGALYVLKYPKDFSHLALSAPMFGIRPTLPRRLARLLVGSHLAINRFMSDLPWYFWGQSGYAPVKFEQNILTHSKARYSLMLEEYSDFPDSCLGGVTSYWLGAALDAMDTISARAGDIAVPVLLLQAENDQIVDNRAQTRVASVIPKCRNVVIPKAKHEILMESDTMRNHALREIHQFFNQQS